MIFLGLDFPVGVSGNNRTGGDPAKSARRREKSTQDEANEKSLSRKE
jgi:hypothetical protein